MLDTGLASLAVARRYSQVRSSANREAEEAHLQVTSVHGNLALRK
jgi:hypothetical protein